MDRGSHPRAGLSAPAQAVGWGLRASCGFWSPSCHQRQAGSGCQLPSPPHTPGPSGCKEADLPERTGGKGGGCLWAGLRSSRIKRSESTIFHCRQSQPRHQLLGQSSLKSLLILFLPLHFFFFSPFLAGVLDKASPPPLLPLPQPTQETGLPKEGLKPEAAGWGAACVCTVRACVAGRHCYGFLCPRVCAWAPLWESGGMHPVGMHLGAR